MASADFKKFARKFLKDFEKTAGEKRDRGKAKVTGRGKLQDQNFSVVVIDTEQTKGAIQDALSTTFENISEAKQKTVLEKIIKEFKIELEKKDISTGGGGSKLQKTWKELEPSFQNKLIAQRDKAAKNQGEFGIIAGKFSGIQDWKKISKNGVLIQAIERSFKSLNKDDPASDYGTPTKTELSKIGGKGATGLQLEHGGGAGIAGSTVRVIEAETRLKSMSRSEKKKAFTSRRADTQGLQKLEKAIETYKVGIKLNIDRQQVMRAADMKLHAHLAPVITITSAASNQQAANSEENAILKEFEKVITELVNLPGSSTIDEMARDGMLSLINGNGKGRKTTGAGRPRKSQRTKTKGSDKGKFERKEKINIIRDKGHTLKSSAILALAKKAKNRGRATPRTGVAPRKSGTSNMPLHLIGIINKDLPDTVRANMGDPALTNQTGTFASSVRATDMNMTPQGFPSIGYTYQRDPYEVHEQDYEYDPRRLIDRSMREIAAQYAIGRFYTRRV